MLQRGRPYACSPSQWCGLVLKVVFPVEGEFLGYGVGARKAILFGGVQFVSYVDCLDGNKQ